MTPLRFQGSSNSYAGFSSGGWSRQGSIRNSGDVIKMNVPGYNNLEIHSNTGCTITLDNEVLTVTANGSSSTSQNNVPDGSISVSTSFSYDFTIS